MKLQKVTPEDGKLRQILKGGTVENHPKSLFVAMAENYPKSLKTQRRSPFPLLGFWVIFRHAVIPLFQLLGSISR